MLLASCVPLFDVSLLNDTGSDIIIIIPRSRPEQVHIPRATAAPVDILVAYADQPEQFTVVSGSRRWHYSRYMDTFAFLTTHSASIAASVPSAFMLVSIPVDESTCCHRRTHLLHNLQDSQSIPNDTNHLTNQWS